MVVCLRESSTWTTHPSLLAQLCVKKGRTCEVPEGSTKYNCGPSESNAASIVADPNGLCMGHSTCMSAWKMMLLEPH